MGQTPTADRYPPWTSALEPAPGDLRIVQAFVNTRDLDEGTEELSDAAALAAWLTRWGLMDEVTELSDADLRVAREVREGLRAVLRGHHGEEPDAGAVERLNRALGAARFRVEIGTDGEPRLVPATRGFAGALARLLGIVMEARTQDRWSRLKACANDGCQWVFYDFSKNRSGKWCAMSPCGNLIKARAYRRRRSG
jgi:predicted RNA-binding Zn ribbon-like protein